VFSFVVYLKQLIKTKTKQKRTKPMETEKMIIEMRKFSSDDIDGIIIFLTVTFSIWVISSIIYTIKNKLKNTNN
tara:strand:- start:45 stop:266 length:222 start_codon:yes stop_codon:yes gene_type:complete